MAVTLGSVVKSTVDPWAIQQRIGTTDARYALNSMLMPVPNLSYVDYRSGVMASGDTKGVGGSSHMAMRVQPGGGMKVTVEMGNAVINTANQGAYMCCLDSVATLTIAASSSSQNRIDMIVARVYDDQNAAIGSPSGTRQFTVEVWRGENSSGTPTAPSVPGLAPAGAIPLAEVRVNAGVSSITTAMITDRRGPGLVARGGMRGLYGADAVEATNAGHNAAGYEGAYPGDQRWVHTNGFQHQVYYGTGSDATRAGWRGVHNALVYNANPPAGARIWTRGNGSQKEICRVTIPYPGTPFMIYPTGRAALLQSPGTAVEVLIKLDNIGGRVVNWVADDTGNVNADTVHTYSVPPIMWGPFTSSVTVLMVGKVLVTNNQNNGFSFRGDDIGHNLLSVVVYPSTVQPPNSSGNDGSGQDIADKSPTDK